MTSFSLRVFGCQMNVYDADRLRTAFVERGWTETSQEEARVLVFLTCSIRDKAEQKVWSELGRVGAERKGAEYPLVAVAGCMAARVGERMARRFPWIRVVVGPRHLGDLPEALEKSLADGALRLLLDEDPREVRDLCVPPTRRDNPWKGFVSIAHGCDNYCSYCIVPYVRGRFQSRSPGEILDEIRALVDDGVQEITLLGQNVNSYGTDGAAEGWTFAFLLRQAARLSGVKRLRFATNHPKDLTDDVIAVMAEEPAVCPSLNLPLQAGSDRILALMNRGYSVERYALLIDKLRSTLVAPGITSDLIVGFPGEREEDFRASCACLERFRFDMVHTASYSIREGTRAASMEGHLSEEVKQERLRVVNALQREISLEINKSLEGRVFEVLLDGHAPRGGGLLQGRTPHDKVVLVKAPETLLGHFVHVEILQGEYWCLRGRILSPADRRPPRGVSAGNTAPPSGMAPGTPPEVLSAVIPCGSSSCACCFCPEKDV